MQALEAPLERVSPTAPSAKETARRRVAESAEAVVRGVAGVARLAFWSCALVCAYLRELLLLGLLALALYNGAAYRREIASAWVAAGLPYVTAAAPAPPPPPAPEACRCSEPPAPVDPPPRAQPAPARPDPPAPPPAREATRRPEPARKVVETEL